MVQIGLVASDAKFRGWCFFSTDFGAFHLLQHGTPALTQSLLSRVYINNISQYSLQLPALALK